MQTLVLVRTLYSVNVGMAARAAANMGADRIVLIDPRCAINSQARQGAAGAQSMLASFVQYPSWDAFFAVEGQGLRVAFSRREGKRRKTWRWDYFCEDLKPDAIQSGVYLVFGPEDNGLEASDLAWMNHVFELPTYGQFGSMNLAQSIIIALYILNARLEQLGLKNATTRTGYRPDQKPEAFSFPDQAIKTWLEAMGFDLSARKASAYLTLRRLLLESHPTPQELSVLEAILQQNIRKLKMIDSRDQSRRADRPDDLDLGSNC